MGGSHVQPSGQLLSWRIHHPPPSLTCHRHKQPEASPDEPSEPLADVIGSLAEPLPDIELATEEEPGHTQGTVTRSPLTKPGSAGGSHVHPSGQLLSASHHTP